MEPYKPHTQIQPFVTLCRIIAWVMVFGSLATVVLTRLSETRLLVWDDAYMFVRYADNIIATGHIAWNAGDSPTYGSTSLLHLLVVTIARLVFPHNPALTAFSSSIVCGVAFLALMVLLVEASARGTPALRLLQVVLVLLCVIFAGPSLAMHFESGMDTTCAMAYLALYIFMAKRWESSPSWPRIMAMMVVGGFAYFARPDLTLFALGVPLFAYLASPSARIRKHAAVAFVGTTGMILLQMLAAWEYFGSPVPLSFYAKSTKLYSESIYVALKAQPWNQLAEYLRQCWLLLPLVVAGQALPLLQTAMPRDRSQHISVEKPEKSVVDTGLFYATVLFVLYYLLLVLQVMPFESRFYYPTYPAIIFLGIQGLALVGGIVSVLFPTNKLPFVVRIGTMTIILALSLTLSGWVGAGFVSSFSRFFHSEVIHLNFDVKGEYRARWRNYWAELDTLWPLTLENGSLT
jgi:hypothetical protein